MAPMFSMVWGLGGAFSRLAMGFFHGQKNSFRKKKLASPKILRGNTLNKHCVPPITADHKQIDNKPWHADGHQG
jgi:hypothetical protein